MLEIAIKYYIHQKNDEIMSKTGINAPQDLEDAALDAIEKYGEYAYDEIYNAIDAVANEYLKDE